MNLVNASTGFSGFELLMGRSPRVLPPLVPLPASGDRTVDIARATALDVVRQLELDTLQAADNLLEAKAGQAASANKSRASDWIIQVGDRVWLKTHRRRQDYIDKSED
ncbi:hypothetical protein CYLTODRAFT_330652, partial [Cylindrobasidium torrendii FP15055 ss-10]